MEFFCFHRDRSDSMALRMELLEEHWSYMDRYARGADSRFLVLGLGPRGTVERQVPSYDHELIAYGPLLSDHAAVQLGTVALVQAPDSEAARAVLPSGRHAHLEVHRWRFGGRPS